ncbi:hypothetical protein BpHYR1_008340 [Brachionus plicatilis]|uniref:Uncharacterized protein n=1 Tax=Brachionus plicatilis TaxID=10195 RepID=A0A3M7SCG1_BRAPC|nr:hypothetical protein BpHYR1_008340 [Brachionus plicatilis]
MCQIVKVNWKIWVENKDHSLKLISNIEQFNFYIDLLIDMCKEMAIFFYISTIFEKNGLSIRIEIMSPRKSFRIFRLNHKPILFTEKEISKNA